VSAATLAADVGEAVEELQAYFGDRLTAEPEADGGALITIARVELAASWGRRRAPLRFVIPYNYPAIPPYPYYLPREAEPPGAWPPALQPIDWQGAPMIQVSLRNNNWDPARDNVLGCVLQVTDWLRAQ
jgi:hypothetical protein